MLIPKNHEKFDGLFSESALKYFGGTEISAEHLKAQAIAESALRERAVSPAGARGVMQIMPATGGELGLLNEEDFFDPAKSIDAGSLYMKRMWDVFQKPPYPERWYFALASYNAGLRHIIKAQARAGAEGFPVADFFGVCATLSNYTFDHAKETLNYIARIKRIYSELRIANYEL